MLQYLICIVATFSIIETAEINLCEKKCINPMSINCSTLNADVYKRCCIHMGKKESDVAGIDLSSCHITSIEDMFHEYYNLKLLYLQNNTIQTPTAEDFLGLTQLQELKLPSNLECPGGNELWNKTEQTSDATICINELSSCAVYNVSCPNKNSYCVDVGPQVTECLCKTGYHGYKCLQKGTFPTLTFVIGLGVSTVIISGLLWVTQRRKAKKQI